MNTGDRTRMNPASTTPLAPEASTASATAIENDSLLG